ncbi:MAG: hypothetical protein ACOCQF_04560 [Halanaerobiaceae bacterium]
MGIHGLIDIVSISLGSLLIKKYFREDLSGRPLEEHLDFLEVDLPELPAADLEGDYQVQASTLVGSLDALFRIAQWRGNEYPTIIYHHGASEVPFDFGFKKIFPYEKQVIEANLILIRAPFHGSRKEYSENILTMDNFLAMVATSVSLIENLISHLKDKDCQDIMIAGTSLGGYVSNFHHIYYNTASKYIPIMAGANFYDTLFESIYRKGVIKTSSTEREQLEELLDFTDEFSDCDNSNVYPLLAKNDRIVRLEVQKESYGNLSVETFDKGHVTGAIDGETIRNHIFSSI